jgi:hypothetical protein
LNKIQPYLYQTYFLSLDFYTLSTKQKIPVSHNHFPFNVFFPQADHSFLRATKTIFSNIKISSFYAKFMQNFPFYSKNDLCLKAWSLDRTDLIHCDIILAENGRVDRKERTRMEVHSAIFGLMGYSAKRGRVPSTLQPKNPVSHNHFPFNVFPQADHSFLRATKTIFSNIKISSFYAKFMQNFGITCSVYTIYMYIYNKAPKRRL